MSERAKQHLRCDMRRISYRYHSFHGVWRPFQRVPQRRFGVDDMHGEAAAASETHRVSDGKIFDDFEEYFCGENFKRPTDTVFG